MADLWWQERAVEVKIKLAKRAGVGESAPRRAAGVAQEGSAAVSWRWEEDQRVIGVQWMLDVAVSVAAVLVEEEVALAAGVDRVVAEGLAAMAATLLPFLHLVQV